MIIEADMLGGTDYVVVFGLIGPGVDGVGASFF